jgi:hypothetical protein
MIDSYETFIGLFNTIKVSNTKIILIFTFGQKLKEIIEKDDQSLVQFSKKYSENTYSGKDYLTALQFISKIFLKVSSNKERICYYSIMDTRNSDEVIKVFEKIIMENF